MLPIWFVFHANIFTNLHRWCHLPSQDAFRNLETELIMGLQFFFFEVGVQLHQDFGLETWASRKITSLILKTLGLHMTSHAWGRAVPLIGCPLHLMWVWWGVIITISVVLSTSSCFKISAGFPGFHLQLLQLSMYQIHACQYWQKSDSNNDNQVVAWWKYALDPHKFIVSFLYRTRWKGDKRPSIANTPTTDVTTWVTPGEWASSPCPTRGEYDSVELGYLFYSCSHCGWGFSCLYHEMP